MDRALSRMTVLLCLFLAPACTTSVEEQVVFHSENATPTATPAPTATPSPTPAALPSHFGIRMLNDSYLSANSGACRIHRGGSLLCWGKSVITGTGEDPPVETGVFLPAEVSGFSSGVSDVSVGSRHVCAIRNGDLFCWGDNVSGEVGVGGTLPVSTPAPVVPPGGESFVQVSAGARNQTCAVTQAGALYCWGNNDTDQTNLGVGSVDATVSTPTLVTGMEVGVSRVDVGAGAICAVKSGGLYCWGANPLGELGSNTLGLPVAAPQLITGLESEVTAVSAGDRSRGVSTDASSICAIRSGALWCLGENDQFQLGFGDGSLVASAMPHPDLATGVTSVRITGAGGCAVQSGQVKCWGAYVKPATGVVDLSGLDSSGTPVPVSGLPVATWTDVTGNGGAFCARNTDLQEYCWGLNLGGFLFSESGTTQVDTPVEAGPFE